MGEAVWFSTRFSAQHPAQPLRGPSGGPGQRRPDPGADRHGARLVRRPPLTDGPLCRSVEACAPRRQRRTCAASAPSVTVGIATGRSEEHTSELQSRGHLVCRLLLEKKKTKKEN